jgi:histone acetyltransferase SAS3
VSGPPSKIKCINFGGYEIETWYAAPYPEEYSRNRVLYICEFCLKYLNSDYVAWRHKLKCPAKHPPGDEIYRDKSVSVFEVDGRKNPVYCQNLCLLAKLFLGSKTLYYDVEPFLFYIMTEHDELGCHFVGYFSKEKRPSSMNNVSCILTLPIHQRKGYGNLLIDFSYLLTRVERKTGSPEKPLSDMGLVSYRNYWRLVLSYELLNQRDSLSIADISDRTGMTADDIVAALEALRALVRDPVTKTYALRLDYDYFRQCIAGWEAKNYVKLNADALIWTPYIMGRGNLASYDRAPPLPTIAPRDGEDDENKPAFEENGQHQVDSTDATKLESSESQAIGTTLIDHASFVPTRTSGDSQVSIINGNHTSPSKPIPSPPSPIPPTRYEIFPPVSGTVARRRGGWRGGIKKSAATTPSAGLSTRRGLNVEVNGAGRSSPRGGTSPRVGSSLEVGQGMSPRAPGTTRRTRSALDGITVAGDEEEEIAIECKTVVKKYEILGSELEQEAIAIERDRSHKSEDSLDEGDDSGSDTDADVDADAGVDGGGNLNGDEDVYRDANGEKEPEHDADEDADSDEMDDIESEVDAMDE